MFFPFRPRRVLWTAVLLACGGLLSVGTAHSAALDDDPVRRIFWQKIQAQDPYVHQGVAAAPKLSAPTMTQPTRAAAQAKPAAPSKAAAPRPVRAAPHARDWRGGVVSEVRLGILSHDVIFPTRHSLEMPNPFKSHHEDGVDFNAEVAFVSPDLLDWLGSPRPNLGFWVNSSGNTNAAYGGLGWDGSWDNGLFLEGFLGMAVHTGKLTDGNPDRVEFGSRALFRLGGELGWRWDDHNGAALIWEHMSNAGLLDDKNQGIDNIGLRYSYRYDTK